MSAFSLRVPAALFSLSLLALVPVPAPAQEAGTPPGAEATQPAAPAADSAQGAPDAPGDVEPGPVALLDDLVGAALPPESVVADVRDDAGIHRALLAHPDAPDLPHTQLLAARAPADADETARQVLGQFAHLDRVADGTFLGRPVWIIEGESRIGPDGAPAAPGSAPRARLVVTQDCLGDGGPVMLGAVTTATRGIPAIMDAILSSLTLSLPEDAHPCPAVLGEALTALPPGPVAPTPAAEAEMPAALAGTEHSVFGLTFRAPEGMRVHRHRTDADRREYTLTSIDEATETGTEISLRVLDQAQRQRLVDAPTDSAEFLAFLSRVSEMDVRRTDTVTEVGSLRFRHFVGAGTGENAAGEPVPTRVLYLITETPTATGLFPWIGIGSTGVPEALAAAIEQMVLSSLAIADPAFYDGAAPLELMDGALRVAILPGDVVVNMDSFAGGGRILVGSEDAPDQAHTLYIAEQRGGDDPDLVRDLRRRFVRISAVTESQIGDTPVWRIEGRADRAPTGRRLTDGSTSPGLIAVTRQCPPGAGPLVLGILGTDERLSPEAPFDRELSAVQIVLPEGSAPCAPTLDAQLAAFAGDPGAGAEAAAPTAPMEEGRATAELLPPPPDDAATDEPGAQGAMTGGKPAPTPMPAQSADDLAWQQALETGSLDGVLAYLQAFPQGAHVGEAQEWLLAQAAAMAQAQTQPQPQSQPGAQVQAGDSANAAWERALADGSREALWTYLKAFPEGPHAGEARAMLTQRNAAPLAPPPAPQKRG